MPGGTNLDAVEAQAPSAGRAEAASKAVFPILLSISFCHLLNDTVQSLIPAIYPLLKTSFHLNYGQVGRIALTLQLTASLLQPVVGHYTDRRPQPYSLAVGMGITMVGLLAFAMAPTYLTILAAAAFVGIGSAVFHPESSRVARMASGGQHGMAQSLFQVGGNAGSAIGPLLAFIFIKGQASIAWFSFLAMLAFVLLVNIGAWFRKNRALQGKPVVADPEHLASLGFVHPHAVLSSRQIGWSLVILMALMFSKFVYLGDVAAGTFIGGPVGDRVGRKPVIWCSILGVLPFTLILPYANLVWTGILSAGIGLILASALSAILVYAQELMPGRIGAVSGLFFGFAFGMGGVGAAILGKLADLRSIDFVYQVCAYLPAIGILTAFLPDLGPRKAHQPNPSRLEVQGTPGLPGAGEVPASKSK